MSPYPFWSEVKMVATHVWTVSLPKTSRRLIRAFLGFAWDLTHWSSWTWPCVPLLVYTLWTQQWGWSVLFVLLIGVTRIGALVQSGAHRHTWKQRLRTTLDKRKAEDSRLRSP